MAEKKNNYKKDSSHCIIKSNLDIKEFLFKRFSENGIYYTQVVRDAEANKIIGITSSQLSRYFNTNFQVKGGLSSEAILWLCNRWGIKVDVKVEYLKNFKL